MRKTPVATVGLLVVAAMLCQPAQSAQRKRKVQMHRAPDTLVVPYVHPEQRMQAGMQTSVFPVQISVTGRAVQVQSDRAQLLPIYTSSGYLYLTVRLSKGTNWLGGLPRGRYFINNRPVTIQ